MDYFSQANSAPLYILVGVVLLFVAISCVLFIRKSYLAGLKMGMDRSVLRTTITSSALFTVLPSISILLGVIALSGSLGVPSAWLRLSVVGNLSYEAIAAEAAAQGASRAAAGVPVTLSATVRGADASRSSADFDAGKVKAVKAAIENGTFKVNAEAVADKLLANAEETLSRSRG